MKRILSLIVLSFLCCNVVFAYCIEGNCYNGQGTWTWSNGHKYVGEFKDNEMHGQGTYTWPSGDKYVGEHKDNKRHGQGTYTWPSGNKYVGEYKDGLQTRGIQIFKNDDGTKSYWVGTYEKVNNPYKGYWKIELKDGGVSTSYSEYDNDKDKQIKTYPITIDDFNKALEYIKLDIELPFDFSGDKLENLEEEKKKIAEEKRKIEEEKRKIAEAKKKQEEEDQKRKEANAKLYVIGSGTGFFVSSEGHVVSNDHVVGICRKVATKIEGKIINFNVINTDEVNDLGLIKGDYKSKNFLNIKSEGAEFGEDIVAFGYPLSDALSTSVKLTRGIVSSLSGPGNNYSEIQIDAAIQPGNSGGPVLNMEGQVVGVASSGLNKLYMLESSEYIPENVNFAVAATTLSNFLNANGVTISNASMNISNTKELAKIGRPATLQLFCMNTKAVHEELKKTKKHSDVLLEKVIELR